MPKTGLLTNKKGSELNLRPKAGFLTNKKGSELNLRPKAGLLTNKKGSELNLRPKAGLLTNKKGSELNLRPKAGLLTNKRSSRPQEVVIILMSRHPRGDIAPNNFYCGENKAGRSNVEKPAVWSNVHFFSEEIAAPRTFSGQSTINLFRFPPWLPPSKLLLWIWGGYIQPNNLEACFTSGKE